MNVNSLRVAAVALSLALLSDAGAMAAEKDIVDTAVDAGAFKTLATALTEAELVSTLKGKGPFTVFAPTDKAFEALPEGVLQDLLKPENKKKLTAILTYHVVAGKVTSGEVVKLSEAKTVNGEKVAIAVQDGEVKVGGAKVVKADIECANGVIHVIDSVLLPSGDAKACPATH